MTEIVIDSGIIVKWFVSEPDSIQARLIYDEYENGNLGLLAPDLLYVEFGNVIWKKQVLQNFDKTDAAFAIEQFKKISFTLIPTTILFDDAFQIAVQYKRTFYDSLYMVLSQRENCQFVTADEKLYNAVKPDFSNIILLADWK